VWKHTSTVLKGERSCEAPYLPNIKNKSTLSNARYFDGIAKISAWQDNYAAAIQTAFKDLNRGTKFNKAKHIQIRHFYSLINRELDKNDLDSICANAKDADLLRVKVKSLQNTLNTYKMMENSKAMDHEELKKQNAQLYKEIKELSDNKKVYRETLKTISQY